MGRIYEIFGRDAHAMTVALMEAARVDTLIPRDASIALKPDMAAEAPPELGASTHPGVLSGAIEYLQSRGYSNLSIIESAWLGERTQRGFQLCGYDQVSRRYGVPLWDLKQDETRMADTPLGPMEVCARALEADVLISLPVLRGHCQTLMACALSSCKGCLSELEKRYFHTAGLMKPIAALASVLKPALTIVDSLCGDLDFEEGGTPVHAGRMFLAADPVQADAYGCALMGLSVDQVPYIGLAEHWGAGSARLRPEDVVTLNRPHRCGGYPDPTGTVAVLTRQVQADSPCSACYAALVRAIFRSGGVRQPVAIGQGWRDRTFDGLGVGDCCNRAACQVRGCPPAPEAILAALRRTPAAQTPPPAAEVTA